MNKSISFYALRFTLSALVAMAILAAVLLTLDAHAPDMLADPGGILTLGTVLAFMLPAFYVGKLFHTHENRGVGFGEGFILSLLFSAGFLLAVVVAVVGANLLADVIPYWFVVDQLRANPRLAATILAIGFAVIALLYWLLFSGTVSTAIKRAAKAG